MNKLFSSMTWKSALSAYFMVDSFLYDKISYYQMCWKWEEILIGTTVLFVELKGVNNIAVIPCYHYLKVTGSATSLESLRIPCATFISYIILYIILLILNFKTIIQRVCSNLRCGTCRPGEVSNVTSWIRIYIRNMI